MTMQYEQENINLATKGVGSDGSLQGVWLVSKDNQTQYGTITAALAAAAPGDVVKVAPGVYNAAGGEIFPLTIPDSVNLEALFEAETVIQGHIVQGANTVLFGLTITPQVGQSPGVDQSGDFAFMTDCVLVMNDVTSNAVEQNGARCVIRGRFLLGGSYADGIVCNVATLSVIQEVVALATTNTAGAVVRVNSGECSLDNMLAINPAATFAYGIRVGANSEMRATNARLFGPTITGAGVYISGDDSVVTLTIPQFDVNGVNVLVDPAVTTGTLNITAGRGSRNGLGLPAVYEAQNLGVIYYSDARVGDEALVIESELSVGSPARGREAAIGEGDGYTRGMVVLRENAGGGTFTDITSDLLLPDGASVDLFDTGAVGERLYVGSPFSFVGIRNTISTALVLGANTVLTFEVSDGGGGWVTVGIMTADANSPYQRHAQEIFQRVQGNQVRFGTGISSQGQQVVDGNNLFWWRVTITVDALGTVPEGDQMKISPNRSEINGDGFMEFFGAAIKPFSVSTQRYELQGASPVTANFLVATGPPLLQFNVPISRFNNNVRDGFAGIVRLPDNLDTSMELTYSFGFKPSTTSANTIDFIFRYGLIRSGAVFDGASIAVSSDSFSIAAGTVNTLVEVNRSFALLDALPGDELFFSLERDGSADTYSGTVAIAPGDVVSGFRYF